VTPLEGGVRLTIETGGLELSDVALGDSICVQGACLTVVAAAERRLSFDVSRETLDCTAGLARPGNVNLEKSLALGDKLGGHLVTGHVDGIGEVLAFDAAGESRLLRVRAPQELARYIARKGSVTVDGVSLTVNRVENADFEVNLIPHTLEVTTLKRLAPGAPVNLEVDLLARYLERMLAARSEA
jgi:riboflavin synthase